ncbi:phospholipase ABHD3-like isoform X1 [Penaeus chinensis]|uniref:phospholipase ABHD3-like isoform X1 n=2 Tax=Penaeus chinensis TaxID=139456 RepID=UPI001FB6DF0B|nr:phospholipase ABHD3-like isoform X1 [Penaeus chinensis]XP_047482096.1 phospholipase ABHD3-like isoform X1 [Penaeus chinensis]
MMDWLIIFGDYPRTTLGFAALVTYIVYYLAKAVKRPLFACRNSAWRMFLEENLTVLHEKYWPTVWCIETHLQTFFASATRAFLPNRDYKREVLRLKDGGEVALDWLEANERKDNPVAVVLPGLTGASDSVYVIGMVMSLHKMGISCAVLNSRGTGGMELKTTRTYCAANSDDLEEALDHVANTRPGAPVIAVGISLGGLIIGHYLTTRKEAATKKLVAAAVQSVPWNLVEGIRHIERPGLSQWFNRYLAYCLKGLVKIHRYQLEGDHPWDFEEVLKSKTVRQFDTRFTAKQFGFDDAEHYYKASTLYHKLDHIKVPFICLNSGDDLFQPLNANPFGAASRSSHVALVVTVRGGHIGFMEGLWPAQSYYSERLFTQLIVSIFSNLETMKDIQKEADDYAKATETACGTA